MTSGGSSAYEVNLGSVLSKVFSRNPSPKAMEEDRCPFGLPYTTKQTIRMLQQEYEEQAQHGGQAATEKSFK
jgi:hypothetical protein